MALWVITDSVTADAVLGKTSVGSVTADAVFFKGITGSVTADALIEGAQILRPDADVSVGSWTPTPLWEKLDDDDATTVTDTAT